MQNFYLASSVLCATVVIYFISVYLHMCPPSPLFSILMVDCLWKKLSKGEKAFYIHSHIIFYIQQFYSSLRSVFYLSSHKIVFPFSLKYYFLSHLLQRGSGGKDLLQVLFREFFISPSFLQNISTVYRILGWPLILSTLRMPFTHLLSLPFCFWWEFYLWECGYYFHLWSVYAMCDFPLDPLAAFHNSPHFYLWRLGPMSTICILRHIFESVNYICFSVVEKEICVTFFFSLLLLYGLQEDKGKDTTQTTVLSLSILSWRHPKILFIISFFPHIAILFKGGQVIYLTCASIFLISLEWASPK